MSNEIIFSCIIPASKKDSESQNLKDLIASIKAQDFPQDKIEILVICPLYSQILGNEFSGVKYIQENADSEQAKAIGIRRAKGEICVMLCADNYITDKLLFGTVVHILHSNEKLSAVYPCKYAHVRNDNSLNRYFSLIGGNDPISYYLGKNDRWPHVDSLRVWSDYSKSYGCNGFFYRTSDIRETDLNHYYPMDNAMEVKGKIASIGLSSIWHRTSDNLINFLIKRYKYARDLYCDRNDRRWRMVDTKEDYIRLAFFIACTITVIQPLFVSIRGFIKVRDWAWAWHYPVCLGFLITYGVLTFRTFFVRLLSARWKDALNPFKPLSKV